MDYTYIIQRAGQLTWQYRFLWIFGLMLSLCNGGGFNFNTNFNFSPPSAQSPNQPPFQWPPQFPSFFPEPLGQTPIMVYVVAGVVMLVFWTIMVLVMQSIGQSALIAAVNQIEEEDPPTLSQSWQAGLNHAPVIGGLLALFEVPQMFIAIISMLITVTQFWPVFSQFFLYDPNSHNSTPPFDPQDMVAIMPLFFATICGTVCISWLIMLLKAIFITFGSRAIILEGYGVMGALGRGGEIFRAHLGPIVLLGLIVSVIRGVIGFVLAMPMMIVLIPLAMMMPRGFTWELMLSFGFVSFVFFILVNMAMSVVEVFSQTVWTLAYRHFLIPKS